MKLKNIDIIAYMNFLTSMSEKKLPQKITYAIVRNLKIIKDEYDLYFESLNKMIKSYEDSILKDEDGNVQVYQSGIPKVDKTIEDEYLKEANDLLGIKVEINLYKIPEESFNYESEKYDALSVKEIMTLIDLMGEVPDKKEE